MSGNNSVAKVTALFGSSAKVVVDFCPNSFNRQRFGNHEDESKIEEEWHQRKKSNPSLFDASKFRLDSISTTPDQFILNIGLTEYKAYLGTHFIRPVINRQYRSLNLGNVIILVTSDDQVPFILRSKTSADDPLRLALPGGHPEPSNMNDFNKDDLLSLFKQDAKAELCEELFLRNRNDYPLEDFRCLGIIDRLPDEKPSMIYMIKSIDKTRLEVEEDYRIGNSKNKDESIDLVWDHVSCLQEIAKFKNRDDTFKQYNLVAETVGAAMIYTQLII